MSEHVYNLADIAFGHVELSSRFVPCTCGNPYCGRFINRKREIRRDGSVASDVETEGLRMVCDGIPPKPKRSLFRMLFK